MTEQFDNETHAEDEEVEGEREREEENEEAGYMDRVSSYRKVLRLGNSTGELGPTSLAEARRLRDIRNSRIIVPPPLPPSVRGKSASARVRNQKESQEEEEKRDAT